MYQMTTANTILDSTLKLNLESSRHIVLIRNTEQNEIIVFQNGSGEAWPNLLSTEGDEKDDELGREEVHE